MSPPLPDFKIAHPVGFLRTQNFRESFAQQVKTADTNCYLPGLVLVECLLSCQARLLAQYPKQLILNIADD